MEVECSRRQWPRVTRLLRSLSLMFAMRFSREGSSDISVLLTGLERVTTQVEAAIFELSSGVGCLSVYGAVVETRAILPLLASAPDITLSCDPRASLSRDSVCINLSCNISSVVANSYTLSWEHLRKADRSATSVCQLDCRGTGDHQLECSLRGVRPWPISFRVNARSAGV
jgi:hypothetical protein